MLKAETDLTLSVIITEALTHRPENTLMLEAGVEPASLRTNLVLGARVPVPKQGGVLFLKRGQERSEEESYGVLISVDVPHHKR